MSEQKDIIVEFSGWVRINPEKVKFQSTVDDSIIDGSTWLSLSEDRQSDYILESLTQAMIDCDDMEYTDVDVFEDDSI